jgi:predicted secreted protein
MASFNGSSGSVTIETVSAGGNIILLHISGWTFDWPREQQDITEFDTVTGWKAKTPGLTKITGTLEGFYQDAAEDALVAAEIVADSIGLVLAADGSRKYTWTDSVNLTNLSFQTEVGVPNRWTAAFTTNTVPTIA